MKVLHYSTNFIAPSETFIARYIQTSVSKCSTAVMSPSINDNYKRYEGLNEVKQFQLKPYNYNKKSVRGVLRLLCEKIRGENLHFGMIRKVVNDYQPDLIHCHFGTKGVFLNTALEKGKVDIPFVVSFYGYDASVKPKRDAAYRKALPGLFKRASAILVEGPELKKKVVALGANSKKVIINPILIPVQEYKQKNSWYESGTPITFVCAGRFVEKKGFHLFLKAMGEIKENIPSFEVLMVGNGEMKTKYQVIIDKFNLDAQVRFLGWKEHEDLLGVMREADFLVHPSVTSSKGDSEGGAPTILLEAQASRVPVIASDHADIPNIMGYSDFLAKEGDLLSLTQKVKNAIQCHKLEELTKLGYEKVTQDHDLDSNIYLDNLFNVLKQH